MSKQTINIGSVASDGTGDKLRVAFGKVNDNFTELYANVANNNLTSLSISGNTIQTRSSGASLNLIANNHQWTLDDDGAINLPNVGVIRKQGQVNLVGSDFVQLQWVDAANVSIPDPNNTGGLTNWLYMDINGLNIETNYNGEGNSKFWQFDKSGNINLPADGDIKLSGRSVLSPANTFVNTDSGNTFSMFTISGASRLSLDIPSFQTINAVSFVTQELGYNVETDTSNSYIHITRDANVDSVLLDWFNSNIFPLSANVSIVSNTSIATNSMAPRGYDNEKYVFSDVTFFPVGGGEGALVNIPQGEPLQIKILTGRPRKAWFDPEALGITNFIGAEVKYMAHVDGANGFTEISSILYTRPYYKGAYVTSEGGQLAGDLVRKLNGAKGDNSDARPYGSYEIWQSAYFDKDIPAVNNNKVVDNKLYYYNDTYNSDDLPNSLYSAGNLHIQWTATVWTGADR